MSVFSRLPGESFLDYLWRNFGGKVVQGESNVILTDDKVSEVVTEKTTEIVQLLPTIVEENVTVLIQEKIVGGDTNSIKTEVNKGVISANLAIHESESPVSLSISEDGVKASLTIDADSSVELSTDSGKLRADIPLQGSEVPLTFAKISSEDYGKIDTIELGKIYLITDSPVFYLDGHAYGATSALITGLITSIRYKNGYIYYSVVGSTAEKSVKIDEVTEENPGLMSSEELKQLNLIIKLLKGVENIDNYIGDKIKTILISQKDNTIQLKYGDDTFSYITLDPDKYLSKVYTKSASLDDVAEAEASGTTISEGDPVLVFEIENGATHFIKLSDLITANFSDAFKDSNTIDFSLDGEKSTADVIIDDSKSNLLTSSKKGLLVDISNKLSKDETNLLRILEDGNLIATLNWNQDSTDDVITFGKGKGKEYSSTNTGQLYFATDTNELLFNGNCYSITEEQTELLADLADAVVKIEYEDGEFTITPASGSSYTIALPIAAAKSETLDGNDGLMSAEQATKLDNLQVMKPGAGLSLDSDLALNINLSENEKILSITDDDNLKISLSLKYDKDLILLIGKNDEVISYISLSSLKDGVITDVSTSTTDDEGNEGFYLVFTWSQDAIDSGLPNKKYIDLKSLLSFYTEGKGISISKNSISIKLSEDETTKKYLSFDEGGNLTASGIDSTVSDNINNILKIINGTNESGEINTTYNDSHTVAEDIKNLQSYLNGEKGSLVTDVKVNGTSVVADHVASINLTTDAVIYSVDKDKNTTYLNTKLDNIDLTINYETGWLLLEDLTT